MEVAIHGRHIPKLKTTLKCKLAFQVALPSNRVLPLRSSKSQ